MAKSMTGYGLSTTQFENTTITVEIRSVNHRFLDIIPKYPRTFLFLEDKIKMLVKNFFSRGRVELHINIEGEGFVQKSISTDWKLLDQFIQQLKVAKERYGLQGEIPFSVLTQLPDLITIQENEEKPDNLQENILACIEDACLQVLEMRIEEGKNLLDDILERATIIRNIVRSIESRRENVIDEYRTRIKQRMEEYIEDPITVDSSRLHQEIALLAEKGDIAEEITRLHSHLDQLEEWSKLEEPIGRKLDFILQEMNREANTVGSKSTDTKISEWTVAMKSEIERIKEQVQNIE
ncbi:YicC/YloC family endoribonuclease [Ornithinibacillus bavariensis]|uniref:YicC/YloC family endoribonuclease n=1 Tax=Ornithinibacillus bavariensis TaxID=545502 RepID=UPI000EE128CC|nr:YicC family protein [Ornithinibacillus sp.]